MQTRSNGNAKLTYHDRVLLDEWLNHAPSECLSPCPGSDSGVWYRISNTSGLFLAELATSSLYAGKGTVVSAMPAEYGTE
jgi:hypothetical protein